MRQSILHHARQQGKVIILNQNDRMFLTRHLLDQRVGESLVDLVVMLPVRRAKRRARMRHMA